MAEITYPPTSKDLDDYSDFIDTHRDDPGGGGGGGTTNYNSLSNKPSIGGKELVGNKTADQLGLATSATASAALNAAVEAKELAEGAAKQDDVDTAMETAAIASSTATAASTKATTALEKANKAVEDTEALSTTVADKADKADLDTEVTARKTLARTVTEVSNKVDAFQPITETAIKGLF